MSLRRNLNLGQSFDGLFSLIPNSISFTNGGMFQNNQADEEEHNELGDDSSINNENINTVKQSRNIKSNNTNSNNPSEQAILSAVYNTIAITLFVSLACLFGLLLIVLQAFVRSILWALLTSAFLFSFKRYLTDLSLKQLHKIENTRAVLTFESILLPIKLFDSSVNYIWNLFIAKYRHLIAIVITIILFHLASSFYQSLFDYSILFISLASKLSNLLIFYVDNSWQLTFAAAVGYFVAISFYWNDKNYKTQLIFNLLSCAIWLSLFFLSTKLMGTYRPFFTIIFMLLISLGFYSFAYESFTKYKRKISNSNHINFNTATTTSTNHTYINDGESNVEEVGADETSSNNSHMDSITSSMHSTNIENKSKQDERNQSDDTIIEDGPSNSSSLSSASVSSNSIIKNTLYNLYQTSIYYFNNTGASLSKTENKTSNSNRKRENSDKYFMLLFWLFICVKLRYDLYVIIPVCCIMWKFSKYSFLNVSKTIWTNNTINDYFNKTLNWIEKRKSVLLPQPFFLLFKLFIKGDLKVNQLLQKSINQLITLLMIVFLSLFVLTTVIVLSMQVHSESIELITIGSNILNENVYAKPELREWLPEKEKLNELYQTTMNNLYLYGREWLSKTLKSSTASSDSTSSIITNKSEYLLIEAQILKQWDSLYSYLSQKSTNLTVFAKNDVNLTKNDYEEDTELPPLSVPSKTKSIGTQTQTTFPNENRTLWESLLFSSTSYSSSNQLTNSFDLQNIFFIIKNNLGILISILDSLYLIIKGNVNLLATILYTVISIIFSGGFALMNFFFSLIIYVTVLFYLLSMSGSRYKPFQWLTEIRLPKNNQNNNNNLTNNLNENNNESKKSSQSDTLVTAIEDSITSVFVVSLKMAIFFGIYTYLINCLFSLSILYLTSILAALLAFLPLVGTYWCSVFGVLELWLIHHKPLNAILFFIMNLLPYLLSVDKAIYSEIKVGHPYLSSLAFAGGVYCLGLEGAIIGPLTLCLFIVIGKIITNTSITTNVKKSKIHLVKSTSLDKSNI